MPSRPKRVCLHPGCNVLVEGGENRCHKHKKDKNKSKENTNEWSTWYSTRRWRKAREVFLKQHPLCVYCLNEDRVVPATVVDHIEDHKGNKEKFWDVDNWQALCVKHHNRKTRLTMNNSYK